VRADHSELILIRHAKEVEAALAKLPPGALHATRRETIRLNLSLLTDGKGRGKAQRSGPRSCKAKRAQVDQKPRPRAAQARCHSRSHERRGGMATVRESIGLVFNAVWESFSKPEPMPAKPMTWWRGRR
jgi:hypothetical protein